MRNGTDFWCFTVIGKPLSKKRVRMASRFSRYTENMWYEKMVADAYRKAFPDSEPYGSECYDIIKQKRKGKTVFQYRLKRGYSRKDVPNIRPFVTFYFQSGNIGDSDNYLKIIQDALNRVAYVDDFQVKAPVPHVIVDPDETERVEILLLPYEQENDKSLYRLRRFMNSHSRVIDIYDNYELDRLHEKTVGELMNTLCPVDCPEYYTCNPRRKDDVIFCENLKK